MVQRNNLSSSPKERKRVELCFTLHAYLWSSVKERSKKVTREGTSVNRKQVKRVCEMTNFGSFLGCLSIREGLYRAFGVLHFSIRLHVFNEYLVRISLDSISILLVFYYDDYY